jgi:hypothetical protein
MKEQRGTRPQEKEERKGRRPEEMNMDEKCLYDPEGAAFMLPPFHWGSGRPKREPHCTKPDVSGASFRSEFSLSLLLGNCEMNFRALRLDS